MCEIEVDSDCADDDPEDVGSMVNQFQPSSQAGNPINVITGNKYQFEKDYSSPSTRLQFNRHYNSHLSDSNRGLGNGWRSSYDTRIEKLTDVGYTITQSNGAELLFNTLDKDAAGIEIVRGVNPAYGYIKADGKKLTWSLSDGRRMTFVGSFLVKIDFPGHQFLKLRYKNKRVVQISDEAGRLLLLEYTPYQKGLSRYEESTFTSQSGHLAKLILPDGNTIEYDYDSRSNLSRVRYSDKSTKLFHYEDDTHLVKLTGITNRLGDRFASWSYDEHGRAISSQRSDGIEKIDIEYTVTSVNPQAGHSVLTNSKGVTSTYYWQEAALGSQRLLMETEGPGCHACPAANMRYTYTDNAQLATATHISGKQVRYEYDQAAMAP